MKKIIKIREYVPKDQDREITLPETEIYLFITGIRAAYRVTPQWTTWQKEQEGLDEEIWTYKILIVNPSECLIKLDELRISEIGNILRGDRSPLDSLCKVITDLEDNKEYFRTKEQFESDYNNVLNKFNEN